MKRKRKTLLESLEITFGGLTKEIQILSILSVLFCLISYVMDGLFFNSTFFTHHASFNQPTARSLEMVILTLHFIGAIFLMGVVLIGIFRIHPALYLRITFILAVSNLLCWYAGFLTASYVTFAALFMGIAMLGVLIFGPVIIVSSVITAAGPVLVVLGTAPAFLGAALGPVLLIALLGPATVFSAAAIVARFLGRGISWLVSKIMSFLDIFFGKTTRFRIPVNILMAIFVVWPLLTLTAGFSGVLANKPAAMFYQVIRARFNYTDHTLSEETEKTTYPSDFYRRYLQHETDWNYIQGHGKFTVAFSETGEKPPVLFDHRIILKQNILTWDNSGMSYENDSSAAYTPAKKSDDLVLVSTGSFVYADMGERYFVQSTGYSIPGGRWQKTPDWNNDFDTLTDQEQMDRVYEILVRSSASQEPVQKEDFYNTARFVKWGRLVNFDENTNTAYFADRGDDGTITLIRRTPEGQEAVFSFQDNFAGEGVGYAWQVEENRFVYADGNVVRYLLPDTGEEGEFFSAESPIVDFNRFFTPDGERGYIFAFENRDAYIIFQEKNFSHRFWIADGPRRGVSEDPADLGITTGFYVWDGGIALRGYNDSSLITKFTYWNDTPLLSSDRFSSRLYEFMEKFVFHQEPLDLYWEKEMKTGQEFAAEFGWTPEGGGTGEAAAGTEGEAGSEPTAEAGTEAGSEPTDEAGTEAGSEPTAEAGTELAAEAASEPTAAAEPEAEGVLSAQEQAFRDEHAHGTPPGEIERYQGISNIQFTKAESPSYGDNLLHLSDYETVSLYEDAFLWTFPKNLYQTMEVTERGDDTFLTFTGNDGSMLQYWTNTEDTRATVTTTNPAERLRNVISRQMEQNPNLVEMESSESDKVARACLKGRDPENPSLVVHILIAAYSTRYQAMILKVPEPVDDIDCYRKGYLFFVLYNSTDMADRDTAAISSGPRSYPAFLETVMPHEGRNIGENWSRFWLPR